MKQKFNVGQRVKCIVDIGDGLVAGTLGTVADVPNTPLASVIFAAVVDFDCEDGKDWPMAHGEIVAA